MAMRSVGVTTFALDVQRMHSAADVRLWRTKSEPTLNFSENMYFKEVVPIQFSQDMRLFVYIYYLSCNNTGHGFISIGTLFCLINMSLLSIRTRGFDYK